MAVQSTVRIIGVPMDLGAGRRGVDMGPSAIRAANLHARIAELGYKVQDAGNVFTPEPDDLWSGVLRRKGGPYGVLALMPPDPSMN